MTDLKVFIGWDSREQEAYHVAKASIEKYSSVEVIPIIKQDLIDQGIYTRGEDFLASSEFTITRFLVPYLSDYKGLSLFMDCDIICNVNIETILEEIDEKNSVSVVKHDYVPKTPIKMDGKSQYVYPRKNWSSVMLFDNHKCSVLTPELVNKSEPSYLHQFEWTFDYSIGSLDHTWNYLAGYYDDIEQPNIIHYTDGGPWFEEYRNCPLANKWIEFYEEINISSMFG